MSNTKVYLAYTHKRSRLFRLRMLSLFYIAVKELFVDAAY
jgi:hypothetical protein